MIQIYQIFILFISIVFGSKNHLGQTVLFDNFNRNDGDISSNWKNPNFITNDQAQVAMIYDFKLCGTTQSIAMMNVSADVFLKSLKFTYLFEASTDAGFESYVIMNANGEMNNTLLIGCDGGEMGHGYCTPTIGMLDGFKEQGDPIVLQVHTSYVFKVEFDQKSITFTIANSYNEDITFLSADRNKFPLLRFTQGGVLVGRSGVSCVDDFRFDISE